MLTQVTHTALLAQGFPRVADRAAVQHDAVAEIARALRRQDLTQLALDLLRLLEAVHQTEAVREPDAVRLGLQLETLVSLAFCRGPEGTSQGASER